MDPRRRSDFRVIAEGDDAVGRDLTLAQALALVDLALRRRFAFEGLTPEFNGNWKAWCINRCGVSTEDVLLIEQRVGVLNREIEQDRSLAPQYRIGHSYVTPQIGVPITNARAWLRDVARTEIVPLLEEYWFDAPEKVSAAAQRLLEGL